MMMSSKYNRTFVPKIGLLLDAVKIIIEKLDWLQLDYKGHMRLEFNFKEKENITWIAS